MTDVPQSRSTRAVLGVVLAVVVGTLLVLAANGDFSPSASAAGTIVAIQQSSAYGGVLVVGGSGTLSGFPLYEFSGDVGGSLGCGTTRAKGYDFGPNLVEPLTCTGPQSDVLSNNTTDDWPALTSGGKPVAGPGVDPALLGTVRRAGVGDQVTYAGHPLYLFDPYSYPFNPQGEGYMETVAPFAPWHGYWFLVSSSTGAPVPGRATVEVGVLPSGRRVVAVEEDPNVAPIAVSVYALHHRGTARVACTGACTATWVPVLSDGAPEAIGVPGSSVGVVHSANGTEQVTFDGQPLYLYSRERAVTTGKDRFDVHGTMGNGDGVTIPDGGTFSLVSP